MVFIYHSGRRLVELGQRLYLKEKQHFLSQPFLTLSFCDWKIKKLNTSVQRHQ